MTIQKLPNGETNPAWVRERQSKVGASVMCEIFKDCAHDEIPVAKTGRKKDEPSEGRATLAKKLAAERLTGYSVNNVNPNNPDIKRGNDLEPVALAAYEIRYGVFLSHARWVDHPEIENSGCTADAFHPEGGLVQVKAPRLDNYVRHAMGGVIPAEWIVQLIWEQAVTRAPWTDFVMYCGEMPEGKKQWVKRFAASNEQIEAMESEVKKFVAEVEHIFETISRMEFA